MPLRGRFRVLRTERAACGADQPCRRRGQPGSMPFGSARRLNADYDALTSCPRISPGLLASVWILTYHFPASSCAICASVNVAEPLIGLARLPLNGTTIPALAPGSAGPWICAAVTGPLRPE